jgi:hypothetical protein
MAGRPAGSRREPVFGRLPPSGEKWPTLTAAGGRACRCDRAGPGEQTRRLTGLLHGQHKSNTSPCPGGVQHASNTDETALPGTPWHGC